MALMKSSEVPKDAVILDELEATSYIWKIISDWDSLSDTWALRHGAVALGAVSSFSGLVINKHYRWRFKLGSYGYLSSTIPIVIMPGILTMLYHKQVVATNILLMKSKGCPICHEIRSGALQTCFGILYPMVLAPTSALMFANRYSTCRVPNLTEGVKVMLPFLKNHTKPFSGTLVYLIALQLAASAIITYFEMKNNITLKNKLLEIERKFDSEELT